jgi:hypothetical protein
MRGMSVLRLRLCRYIHDKQVVPNMYVLHYWSPNNWPRDGLIDSLQ